jgi:hypothetical protein
MSFAIKCLHDEQENVKPELPDSPNARWLKSFDPDARAGLGLVEWTRNPNQALKFADMVEASEYYHQQSQVRPPRAERAVQPALGGIYRPPAPQLSRGQDLFARDEGTL